MLAGAAVLTLLLGATGTASAQTYTVTRTDDPIPGPCEPGDCSLREALTAANATTAVDDLIVLSASAAPYLIQYEELSLPINDEVEIRGAGADKTVVKGDGKEIVFTIGSFKTTLVGLTITGGKGAIQNNGALTIRGVGIEGNEREDLAGGISSGGPVTIESSFLGFNHTDTATGGAIHSNGAVTIVNSTVAHNSSEQGPAAIGVNSLLTIRSSAVVSNSTEATTSAGVAAIELTVRDSVFADNRNATDLRNCSSGTPTSLGGNVSDDDTCGTGPTDKPNVNPLLGTLALHGGTTRLYDLLPGNRRRQPVPGSRPARRRQAAGRRLRQRAFRVRAGAAASASAGTVARPRALDEGREKTARRETRGSGQTHLPQQRGKPAMSRQGDSLRPAEPGWTVWIASAESP